jgi:dTMP kinase
VSGLFITFEGTEGSGKSTQIDLAFRDLRAAGFKPLLVREPGSTALGEKLREILKDPAQSSLAPEAELLLMNASRAQLVREIILPALHQGRVVLSDRFADSTVAYQQFGRGLDPASVRNIIHFATGGLSPDLTILLRVPVALSEARRKSRSNGVPDSSDRIEDAGRAFFDRVEQGYDHIAASAPDRVVNLDASSPVEAVHAQVSKSIQDALARKKLQPLHHV